ncbi:S-antigen, C-terminal domain-containing protein [Glomus cerebriforme]|uniref:S-antigen, C-terminal domain-containing protein n=1 Tax=Glomus cerebriforme TaxID=658196 RepID=A0A397SXT2_9GLOM|nr:S-antigen, C-terminal domain-containing protein [Glomus cerebriforme]
MASTLQPTSQNLTNLSLVSTTMTHSTASSSNETIPQTFSPITAHQLNNAIPQKLKFNKLRTSLELKLVEPVIFFRGKPEEAVGCVLRGDLILNLAKETNIRKLEMKFIGKTKTLWREDKRTISEEREIISHSWEFIEPSKKSNYNVMNPFRFKLLTNTFSNFPSSSSSSLNSSSSSFKLSMGTHTYPFELYLPGNLPETTNTELGTVKYYLKAKAYRSRLSPKIRLSQEVEILRTLPDHINSQGIGFSREFNDLLSYEINIPKKAYPLGQQIPIDMKISPYIKKLKVTGVRVQVVEKTTYTSRGQKVTDSREVARHNLETFGKNRLIEEEEGDLGNVVYQQTLNLSLPKCVNPVHYSCTTPLISVAHDLKFSFLITLPRDARLHSVKQAELKISVPITILSCKAIEDYVALPSYEDDSYYCPCHPEYLRMARLVLGENEGNRLETCHNGRNIHLNVQRTTYNRAPPSYEDSMIEV